MLYITTPKGTGWWHVGEPVNVNSDEVIRVQADGDELEHIVHKFHNIPYSSDRVQKWFGDMAKFIVGNL